MHQQSSKGRASESVAAACACRWFKMRSSISSAVRAALGCLAVIEARVQASSCSQPYREEVFWNYVCATRVLIALF